MEQVCNSTQKDNLHHSCMALCPPFFNFNFLGANIISKPALLTSSELTSVASSMVMMSVALTELATSSTNTIANTTSVFLLMISLSRSLSFFGYTMDGLGFKEGFCLSSFFYLWNFSLIIWRGTIIN